MRIVREINNLLLKSRWNNIGNVKSISHEHAKKAEKRSFFLSLIIENSRYATDEVRSWLYQRI